MNIKKTKITLDKINALFKSLSATDNSVSSIEKDLMLTYVRQLYENVLDTSNEAAPAVVKKTPIPTPPPAPKPKPRQPELEIVPPEPPVKAPEPPQPIKTEDPPPKPTPKAPPTPPPPPPPVIKKAAPKTSFKNIDKLFDEKKATELSDILSQSPISDLTRAMSINDRLLYMNELFSKDIEALNGSLSLLNKYDSIEEAKGLLANLAEQYNWLAEEKLDLARTFIKLVKRRYK